MQNVLYSEDGKITVNKQDIVFIKFNKVFILALINVLIEFSEFKFFLLESFSEVLFFEMFENLF